MKRGLLLSLSAVAAAWGLYDGTTSAGVTAMTYQFTYQGRLDVGGVPFTGTAQIRFTLWDSLAGGAIAPAPAPINNVLGVSVTEGVFTATLDFGPSAFVGDQRWLQMEVDTTLPLGDVYSPPLAPRQLLTATPYAAFALAVNGANVTNLNANNLATGTVPSARISGAYTSAVNFSNAANTFTGTFTGSGASITSLNAGNISTGLLPIARGGTAAGTAAAALANLNAQARVTGTAPAGSYITGINVDGTVVTALDANSGGDITSVGAGAGLAGGGVSGAVSLNVAANGIVNTMLASDALSLNKVSGGAMVSSGGNIGVGFAAPTNWLHGQFAGNEYLRAEKSGTGGPFGMRFTSPDLDWYLLMDNGLGPDDSFNIYNGANRLTIMETGQVGIGTNNAVPAAMLEVLGSETLKVGEANGEVFIDGTSGTIFGNGTDGLINWRVYNGIWGEVNLWDETGNNQTVLLTATANSGGQLHLRNEVGVTTLSLYGNFGGTGDSRIVTDELQINGGSDLSEQFDIASTATHRPEPGMVVSINPEKPGELAVSQKAYDRCVAGIISGANGIKPGMLMAQKDTEADGAHPVALTGRVYVRVTEANGSIEPGDLLTSSDEPGLAMKVTDFARAQGAIIGKAMTRANDQGMVLVLVGLQ